jgi:hypothetical protein
VCTITEKPLPVRQFILAIGILAAVAAVIFGALATLSPHLTISAKCPPGESEDLYTDVCVPELAPSVVELTPSVFGGAPEVDGVPCTGHNSYECIGLAEESLGSEPTPTVNATVSAQTGAPAPSTPASSTDAAPPTGQDVILSPNVQPPDS